MTGPQVQGRDARRTGKKRDTGESPVLTPTRGEGMYKFCRDKGALREMEIISGAPLAGAGIFS